MTGDQFVAGMDQPVGQARGERQFALRRGMGHAQLALQAARQQRVGLRCRWPRLVVHVEQPDRVEAHPGGLERAEDLHGRGPRFGLEQGLLGDTAQQCHGVAETHPGLHLAERGELAERALEALVLLILVAVQRPITRPTGTQEQPVQMAGPGARRVFCGQVVEPCAERIQGGRQAWTMARILWRILAESKAQAPQADRRQTVLAQRRVDEVRAHECTPGYRQSADGEGVAGCQLLFVASRGNTCCTARVQYRPGPVDDRHFVVRYLFTNSEVPPALEIGVRIETEALCKHVIIVAQ